MTTAIFESKPASGPAATKTESCAFSIIIPAFNEEEMIGRCLSAIEQLDYPKDAFEVIVVDNGSADRTREIAQSFADRIAITVLLRPKVYISALRNAGAHEAQGRICAFLDADILVPPDWLRKAESIFTSLDGALVGGASCAPEDSSWVARSWFGRRHRSSRWQPAYVPSCILLVSRSDFQRIGGFDERLQTSEDCDFSFRARDLGLRLEAFTSISAVNLGCPQTLRAFYQREVWHGASATRVFLRNMARFRNGKATLFAAYMLACLAGIILGLGHAVVLHRFTVMSWSVLLACLAPLFLGILSVRSNPNLADFTRLSVLYLLYGVARAMSLLRTATGIRILRRHR